MLQIINNLFNKKKTNQTPINLSSYIKIKLLLTYIDVDNMNFDNITNISNQTLSNINSISLLLDNQTIEYIFYHDFEIFLSLLKLFKLNLISIKQKMNIFISLIENSLTNHYEYFSMHSNDLFEMLEYISDVDQFNNLQNLMNKIILIKTN
jgi:hypothetical protein